MISIKKRLGLLFLDFLGKGLRIPRMMWSVVVGSGAVWLPFIEPVHNDSPLAP